MQASVPAVGQFATVDRFEYSEFGKPDTIVDGSFLPAGYVEFTVVDERRLVNPLWLTREIA